MKKIYLLFLFSIICATASAQLTINEALFDPESGTAPTGDANGDGTRDFSEDEFLEIVNTSGSALDISGYKIYDDNRFSMLPGTDDPRHIVPALTTIPAGGIYVVFGGGDVTAIDGLANVTAHTASSGQLNMTNDSETITITDASGTVITSISPNEDGIDVSSRIEQSIARVPVLTGPFIVHTRIDGTRFSPGVLATFTPNFLVLNEFLADPETGVDDPNNDGDPSPNDDEFLEFVNNSGAAFDISGFKLYDLTDFNNELTSHVFPAGSVVPDGGVIVLFDAGSPQGTFGDALVQTCDGTSTNGFTLTNGGQTIYVTDASDNLVFVQSYTGTSGDDQSQTRNPDITGNFVLHTTLPGGAKFSPGTRIDGTPFITRNESNVASGDWNVGGTWTLGVPTGTSNVEIASGNTVTVTSDNQVVNNLEVKGSLVINSTESLTVNGSLEVSGTVTINSGGSLIVSGTSLGNVAYNRELTFEAGDLKGWHTVGSPVAGQAYDDAYATTNDLATKGTNRGLGSYDTNANAWVYLTTGDANSGTFDAGVGYTMKRGATTGSVAFTGTINTIDTGIDVVLSTDGARFNALSNPYTSFVNSATFLDNEGAVSETKTLWVWNQTLLANGDYEVKTVGSAMVIAPGQGFFVKANAAGGTFNFTESNQNHNAGADTFQKTAGKTEVNLWITDGSIKNYSKIHFLDNSTTGFDVGYEGEMFNSSSPFAVYSHLITDNQGKNYQIQSLPNSDYENMIIPIGLNAAAGKEITFSTEALNLPTGLKVFLEDKLTNSFTRLDEANSNYKVTLTDKSEGTGRFYLHTKASSVLSTDTFGLESISIYKTNNYNLKVAGVSQGKASIKLFNILGKQVLNTSFSANGNNDIALPQLATGVYIIQLETENGNINKKITLE